jgi:hypothetical protein
MDVKGEAPEGPDDKACCVCFEQRVANGKGKKGNNIYHKCGDVDFTKVCKQERRFSCFYTAANAAECVRFDTNGEPISGAVSLPDAASGLNCRENFVVVNIGLPKDGYSRQVDQIYCGTTQCTEWARKTGQDPRIVCVAGAGSAGSVAEKQYICDLVDNLMKNPPKEELGLEFALAPVKTGDICIEIDHGKPTGSMQVKTLKITIYPDGTLEAEECGALGCSLPMDYSKFKKTYCTAPAVGQPAQGNTGQTRPGATGGTGVSGNPPNTGIIVELYSRGPNQGCRPCDELHTLLSRRPELLRKFPARAGSPIGSVPYVRVIQNGKILEQHPAGPVVDPNKIFSILDKYKDLVAN